MWQRKTLKSNARIVLKRSYWRMVIVCLIMAFFVGAYAHNDTVRTWDGALDGQGGSVQNSQTVADFVMGVIEQSGRSISAPDSQGRIATRGILSSLFDSYTKSGSFAFGIVNSINQFLFGGRVMSGVVILLGAAVSFLFWLLVGNILRIGECRFFLECRLYPQTQAHRLLYLYKIRRVRRAAAIMFFKTLYTVLWSLTIAGGIVKHYSYRMVPYIVAENPEVTRREAFALSRRMMRGNKWRAFLLDLSFLPLSLLSMLTLGLLGFLYLNPYRTAADAELYQTLRRQAIDRADSGTAAFRDHRLFKGGLSESGLPLGMPATAPSGQYPVHLFAIPEQKSKRNTAIDYHRRYTPSTLVLLFFSFCFVGWLWEFLFNLFGAGRLVNPGVLRGPWLPIYGTGGVLVVILLKRWIDRPVLTFVLVMGVCAVMEYGAGWYLDTVVGVKWWDYSGFMFNLSGYVCLEGLILFGLGGCASIYVLSPLLDDLYQRMPKSLRYALVALLLAAFAADIAYSAYKPHVVEAIASVVGLRPFE